MKRRNFLKSSLLMGLTPTLFSFTRRENIEGILRAPFERSPFHLPNGFECKILQQYKDPMSDGLTVPGSPDGMGIFQGKKENEIILMRNHELNLGWGERGQRARPVNGRDWRRPTYDKMAPGGVSRLVVDKESLQVLSSNMVLEGTVDNCAGGVSPWGWFSCEENVERDHGYVFLCNPFATQTEEPNRILSLGRFNHEAAVYNPKDHAIYLTEDRSDSCLYRLLPYNPAKPFEGKLQALKLKHHPEVNLGKRFPLRRDFEVEWVDVPERRWNRDDLRYEMQEEKGAAIVVRGEGLCEFHGKIYFCATKGGPIKKGQIFCYTPSSKDEGVLMLMGQAEDRDELDMPDNIIATPWGSIYMAEDGGGNPGIKVMTKNGKVLTLAINAQSRSEIAGVCFSPDFSTLFSNIQGDGLTVAIRGNFKNWEESLLQ